MKTNDIARAEHRKLVAEQICAMPIDTYEGARAARLAASGALISMDWESDAEAMKLLIFSRRARDQIGALSPNPSPVIRYSGP